MLDQAWKWVEDLAATMIEGRAIIAGDLNTPASGARSRPELQRMLASGWHRAEPTGAGSFFSQGGQACDIEHVLATPDCLLTDAEYVTSVNGYILAGAPGALSDHAAVVCIVEAP
jgi:hypothetical protein